MLVLRLRIDPPTWTEASILEPKKKKKKEYEGCCILHIYDVTLMIEENCAKGIQGTRLDLNLHLFNTTCISSTSTLSLSRITAPIIHIQNFVDVDVITKMHRKSFRFRCATSGLQ